MNKNVKPVDVYLHAADTISYMYMYMHLDYFHDTRYWNSF